MTGNASDGEILPILPDHPCRIHIRTCSRIFCRQRPQELRITASEQGLLRTRQCKTADAVDHDVDPASHIRGSTSEVPLVPWVGEDRAVATGRVRMVRPAGIDDRSIGRHPEDEQRTFMGHLADR